MRKVIRKDDGLPKAEVWKCAEWEVLTMRWLTYDALGAQVEAILPEHLNS